MQTLTSTKTVTPRRQTPSRKQEFDPSGYVADWQDEQARGKAEPVETQETVESTGAIEAKCAQVGHNTVMELVMDRIDETNSLGFIYDRRSEGEYEYTVTVARILEVARDGDVTSKPRVSFETLRSVTPRSVKATAIHDETEHTCQIAVYVQDRVYRDG